MKTFTIALMAGAAMARRQAEDPRFLKHVGEFNVQTHTTADFQLRQSIFQTNDDAITRQNRKAEASDDPLTLRLKHNKTSTMTRSEYLDLLGLDTEQAEAKATTLELDDGRDRGIETASTVDHFKDGFMHTVKDQGNCGSCWAFGANTTLEGTIAKKTNKSPVRLSEQQLVDCTLTTNNQNYIDFGKDYQNWGCEGGWMSSAWDFQIDNGIMLDQDYSYTSGNTNTETKCAHKENKVELYAKNYGQIRNSVSEMKETLMEQPLSVALDAGSYAFQFYSSGVVREEDNCGTSLNHAVVIVGYTDEDGGNDDDDDDDDEESEDEESDWEDDSEDEEESDDDDDDDSRGLCTVEKWWHSCDDVEGADSRRLSRQSRQTVRKSSRGSNNKNYWKIQNSWGTGWGDQGFILIGIEGGSGVCGINSVVEWVEAKNLY